MKTGRLTPKQKKLLEFIENYMDENGYAPTQQEIAEHFGYSSLGTVQNYLIRLEEQGFLKRKWNGKRALDVVNPFKPQFQPPQAAALELPLLGYVAAGKPIEAILSNETLEVPPSMAAKGENFALKVKGDSMIEDGILDGDYVIVRRQPTASNGQTVVATINGEATVKKFYRKGKQVELHPANSSMEPFILKNEQSFRIEGIVAGVIRLCC